MTTPAVCKPAFRAAGLPLLALGFIAVMLFPGCKAARSPSAPVAAPSTAGSEPGEARSFGIGHGVELEFRWAPAGSFMMGGERQQQSVRIIEGFWVAEKEVTPAIWQAVMGEAPALTITAAGNPGVQVSWNDCRRFLKRLKSPEAGWRYDVPTEAQWEYACRAGANTSDVRRPAKLRWIEAKDINRGHQMGMTTSNSWSIRDMHGNVAEWFREPVGAPKEVRESKAPFLQFNQVGFRLVLIRDRALEERKAAPAYATTATIERVR